MNLFTFWRHFRNVGKFLIATSRDCLFTLPSGFIQGNLHDLHYQLKFLKRQKVQLEYILLCEIVDSAK